ncbi:MAG TPA: exopolyphosphatase [Bacteroidetes bacterium]|nr:exopolyphosphatase [Bacteroidota bacterium]
MRKAVIDLGTNTFHLLISEQEGEQISEVSKIQIAVKLGEGGIEFGRIAPPAFERGQKALEEFRKVLNQFPCEEVHIIATSAIRSAENGKDFIREAEERSGFKITCISGMEEAEWIAKGVFHSLPTMSHPYIIMDIGGGSVEFILCEGKNIIHKQSLDIGAARLLARFKPSDPILASELGLLKSYLEENLSGLMHQAQDAGVTTLVGSAGSFESILELVSDLPGYESKSIGPACFIIPMDAFDQVYKQLLASTKAEREQMKGLADYRVEMMVVSAVLVDTVIKMARIDKVYCSLYSLKEGVLFG